MFVLFAIRDWDTSPDVKFASPTFVVCGRSSLVTLSGCSSLERHSPHYRYGLVLRLLAYAAQRQSRNRMAVGI